MSLSRDTKGLSKPSAPPAPDPQDTHSQRAALRPILFIFYGSVVNLQCCVSFKHTAKWFHYTDKYICILFHILFQYRLLQGIEYSSLFYTVGPTLYYFYYFKIWSFLNKPAYSICWWMFHVKLKRLCVLLLSRGVFCKCKQKLCQISWLHCLGLLWSY